MMRCLPPGIDIKLSHVSQIGNQIAVPVLRHYWPQEVDALSDLIAGKIALYFVEHQVAFDCRQMVPNVVCCHLLVLI